MEPPRENARLAQELAESRRQQSATSEILRVISSSPTDIQPIFDAIVRSAVNLCGGMFSTAFRFDGELVRATSTRSQDKRKEYLRLAKIYQEVARRLELEDADQAASPSTEKLFLENQNSQSGDLAASPPREKAITRED